MYTGIVQGLEKVVNIRHSDHFTTLYISNENHFFDDIFIGASVAIDGTCLTATGYDTVLHTVSFDVSTHHIADHTTIFKHWRSSQYRKVD